MDISFSGNISGIPRKIKQLSRNLNSEDKLLKDIKDADPSDIILDNKTQIPYLVLNKATKNGEKSLECFELAPKPTVTITEQKIKANPGRYEKTEHLNVII